MGVDGYKFLEGKPQIRKRLARRLDDPIFDKMYSFIEEMGMPMTMHLGDPPENWDITKCSPYAIERGWFCDETYPTLEELREETEGILKKHPKLKLTLAHFYFLGHDLEAAKAFLERFPNASFDLTPGGEMYDGFSKRPSEWREFFIKYSNRILYGTDTYNVSYPDLDMYEGTHVAGYRINLTRRMLEEKERFEYPRRGTLVPLALDRASLENIYFNNAASRHAKPREVDRKRTAQYTQTVLSAMQNGELTTEERERDILEIENLQKVMQYFS